MMDIQIEQYLSLGIWLKRKLGSHNSYILSKQGTDHHDVSRSTNLLPSPFACRLKIKYFGGLLPVRVTFKIPDWPQAAQAPAWDGILRKGRHGENVRVSMGQEPLA